jgi:hypothetical protein
MRAAGRYLLVRLLFSAAAFAFVLLGLLAFTPGFGISLLGLLVIFGFVGTPFFFYVAGVKTPLASYLTGLALLGLTAWVQLYVNVHSYSSTAGVAYLGIFLYGWAIVFMTLLVERLALTGGSRVVRVSLGVLILALGALVLGGLTGSTWPVIPGFALIGVASVIAVRVSGKHRRLRKGLVNGPSKAGPGG